MSFNNLSAYMSELGRLQLALAPAEEATDLYRRLADANPAAYLPDLAMSLSNLSAILSRLGLQESVLLSQLALQEQALASAEEAIAIRRQLVAAHPDGTVPGAVFSARHAGLRSGGMGTVSDDIERCESTEEDRG